MVGESFHPEQREGEPKLSISRRYYFFRHFSPIYGAGLGEQMTELGYPPETYSSARFTQDEVVDKESKYRSTPEELEKFEHAGLSMPAVEKTDFSSRAPIEGIINDEELEGAQNLAGIVEKLRNEKSAPFVVTGPRTRHEQSAHAIDEYLSRHGIDVAGSNAARSGYLTDARHPWIEYFKVAKEAGAENPWTMALDFEQRDKAGASHLEAMPDFGERMMHFLRLCERVFRNNQNKVDKQGVVPTVFGVTSDFGQVGLLQSMGVEAKGFRPTPGSDIEIEITKDGKANVYYQSLQDSEPLLLAQIDDWDGFLKKDRE